MNKAKQAAARSWQFSLSSGGETNEKDTENKMPPPAPPQLRQKEAIKEPHLPKEPFEIRAMQDDIQQQRPILKDEAAERERLVSEFNQRKKDAASNKARGVAQWAGVKYSPRPLPQAPHQAGIRICLEDHGLTPLLLFSRSTPTHS